MELTMLTSQVVPLILSVMDGYPSLLLAYGELASGWNFSNFIPSTIIIIIMKYHRRQKHHSVWLPGQPRCSPPLPPGDVQVRSRRSSLHHSDSLMQIFRMASQRETEGESSYTFNVSVLLVTSDAAIDLLVDRRRRGTQVFPSTKNAVEIEILFRLAGAGCPP
jgi:hypothetical protein